MTFLLKLAQRLARMSAPILVGVLATSACEQLPAGAAPVTQGPAAPASVASVSVTPGAVSAATGQTVQLTAIPRDSIGTPLLGRAITWRSSNNAVVTVNASGLATGVPSGSATITATSEGKSGTAAITVTQTPAPVASVTVIPAPASVPAGQTLQLAATLRDASGNILLGRTVTWSSSNTAAATVVGGLTRGVTEGSATITATSEGKLGPSALTITAPLPVGAWPNEPAGMNLVNEQAWDCLICNGWNYHSEDGYADIQADATAPKSASNVLRVVFPTTLPNDHQPAINFLGLGGPRPELYSSYWMKLSPNWDEHGTKLNMIWAGDQMVYLHLSDGVTKKVGLVVLWSPYGYDNAPAGPEGSWPSNVATTPITAGQWYLVELYMKYPTTPGGSDGIIRWWVNGTMQGNYTSVRYPANAGFVQYDYPFTRQVAPAQQQYMYIDHSHVSAR